MSNKQNNSHGKEILGTILFTIVLLLLMWGLSIWKG